MYLNVGEFAAVVSVHRAQSHNFVSSFKHMYMDPLLYIENVTCIYQRRDEYTKAIPS